jgi:murein DD-endopeptidase MepM/ murein hydrolase activator NlpD
MSVFFVQHHGPATGVRAFLGVFLLLTVLAGVGGLGFWYGQIYTLEQLPASQTVAMLESMFDRERGELEAAKQESLSHLDALSGRLGGLQAEVLRLNALGERLVQMASLSADEFDFNKPPPLGGPEPTEALPSTAGELAEEIENLFSELQDRDRKLSLLEELIMERDLQEQIMPAGRPVLSGYITSKFGPRKDPLNGRRSFHHGVDFAAKRGTEIVAVADGLVIASERRSGYGRTVEIRHGNGLVTRYAHNQKLLVKVGDLVKQGQAIATVGSSGRVTGPHLHFEVLRDGKHVDPMAYVGATRSSKKREG